MLLVEPDLDLAHQAMRTLSGRDGSSLLEQRYQVRHVESLAELHDFDLESVEVVICEINLPDGFGFDALVYCQGMRSNLPVVLVGDTADVKLAAECIGAGASDFILKTETYLPTLSISLAKVLALTRIKRDNERLQRELSRTLAELAEKNFKLERANSQLETMARTDELTSLGNRRWLNEMLCRTWADAVRHDRPLACLMIDLDDFKRFNDERGHQYGDQLLQTIGRIITTNCRLVDTVARYGGDEFCILMPQTEPDEAVTAARRIQSEFNHAIGKQFEMEANVSMSIGLSHINLSHPASGEQLVAHADEALYAAKSAGKGQILIRGARRTIPANDCQDTHGIAG